MTIEDLKHELERLKIPKHWYHLGGYGNDDQRICIEENGGKWTVYFSERGIKFHQKEFNTEDEACNELLQRLRKP